MTYCTLFDSVYLSRGLIMYESLKKKSDEFHLYIFAFDDLAYRILKDLKLEFTTIVSLKEFESEDLLKIKSTRTRAEYCWTCTSSIIEYVFERFMVNSCTYLDADLYFYGSPQIILNELSGKKSVLITEHRYSGFARLYEQKRAGRFCVQFVTFKNSMESRAILTRWISQCIEWCYARYEEGKFGDQKYLDEWPDKFPIVHILDHKGGGVAPWNVNQYSFFKEDNKLFGRDKKSKSVFELIFFHFHYVRISRKGYADLGWNKLQSDVIEMFYKLYLKEVIEKEKYLQKLFPDYKTTFASEVHTGFRDTLKNLFKKVTRYNLIKLP